MIELIDQPSEPAGLDDVLHEGAPVVRVEQLSVALRGIPALHNVCLSFEQGEFVLISGPSGSGKSTLARAVAGLLNEQPGVRVEGEITINNLAVLQAHPPQVARHVGLVFQNPRSQLFNLTVEEELAWGPGNLRLDSESVQARVKEVAQVLNLERLLSRRINTLSGGEMQLVAIGAVLAMGSRILILDEPTSSLDVAGTRQVIEALERLQRDYRTTILLIEHRLGEVAHLTTRTVLLEAGRVIADGKSAKILQDSTLLRRLGLRRPAPEPLADWDQLLQPNGTYPVNEQPILTLQNVDASYGKTTVLHDLSLSFWPGEFVALVGENGAGKSTLAMIAAGLKRPGRGRVALRGQKGVRLGLDVGLLFQNPLDQLFCDTVEEEIAFGPRNYDCFHPETHGRTMVECDLTAIRERPARALSAGQQQRVALGAVLALRPALLIVDEPTLGQDWGHLERLMSFLCHLNEQGTTILMITHDYKLVHRYADRVVLLHEGRVVADGQPIRRERRQEHEIYTA